MTSPSAPEPVPPPPPPPSDADGWQRLDPRMLLVNPVSELVKFVPVIVGVFLAGTAAGGPRLWQLFAVVVPLVLGVLHYYTTSYRIGPDRVELRRGLLSRHHLSTPLDRVRTVDLTASPVHRILGVATVRIGTGTASPGSAERIDLDGLPAAEARALRTTLLNRVDAGPRDTDDATGPEASSAPPAPRERPAAVFHPSWLRYAPLTPFGFVVVAGLVGALSQLTDLIRIDVDTSDWSTPAPAVLLIGLVVLLVVFVAIAVAGYLTANWGYRLARAGGAWHVSRGLLTTRETSIDVDRLAGVAVGEPLHLRAAQGASLSAIVTGLGSGESATSALLVPAAPRSVVGTAAATVLGTTGPLATPLRTHGPAALRRRYIRALVPAAILAAVAVGFAVGPGGEWLLAPAVGVLVAALGLAHDRSRALGHTLVAGFLVARSGSLARKRHVLRTGHVIGWTYRATWFQRRVGLTTVVATTAGGSQSVTVLDVPEADGVALSRAATPGLVEQFLASPRPMSELTVPPDGARR